MKSDQNSVNAPKCPIELVVEIIGSKWTVPILMQLFIAPRRPSQLLKALGVISQKSLTDRLRELEKYGLISREIFPQVPPCVEYRLTSLGEELRDVLLAMKAFGLHWQQHTQVECSAEICGVACNDCLVSQPQRHYEQ